MDHKWTKRFMELARHISNWSKDPSTQVGVVAISPNKRILSTGYNGFPSRISDNVEFYNNREYKYKLIIHGEQNCILNAAMNGVSLKGSYLFVWGMPVCNECAKSIIQVGIERVYWGMSNSENIPEKWKESLIITNNLFKEAGIEFVGPFENL